jgi:hypothetical protein
MSRDPATYGRVREQYDEWVEMERDRPARPFVRSRRTSTPPETGGFEMGKTVFAAIGIGIGVVILVLAGLAFWSAASWSQFGRDGAVVGYALSGFFLTVSGLGAIIATWNHIFRVLARPGGAQH